MVGGGEGRTGASGERSEELSSSASSILLVSSSKPSNWELARTEVGENERLEKRKMKKEIRDKRRV